MTNMPRLSSKTCIVLFSSAVIGLVVLLVRQFPGSDQNSNSSGGNSLSAQGGADAKSISYNDSQADELLRTLCDLYKEGQISGDLCNSLCYYYNQWQIISYHTSTKHVLVLSFGGQKLVLKSQMADFTQFEPLDSELLSEHHLSDYLELIRTRVNDQLGIGWSQQLVQQLVPMIWPPYQRTRHLSEADKRSLWSLVQQEEYNTFAVLPLARVFPKLMGSCGNFYAVEYVVPFRMKPQYMNLRAKILVHLMGTLKLFYEFLNEPLHWCDVRFDSFGLSADYPKRFLLMDADLVFTESRMQRLMTQLGCRTDADCHFMDCEAKCDQKTRHCTNRLNDNVEVFCKKFVNTMFTSPYGYKNNRYISSCQDKNITNEQRLRDLRVVWAWSLSDV